MAGERRTQPERSCTFDELAQAAYGAYSGFSWADGPFCWDRLPGVEQLRWHKAVRAVHQKLVEERPSEASEGCTESHDTQ